MIYDPACRGSEAYRELGLEVLKRNGIKITKKKQKPTPNFSTLESIGESKGYWPFRKS